MVSLEFKIEFEGIEKNEYPNGLKFSTADILSTAVLSEVYEENNLKRYFGFPEFKGALTVYQINDKLKFLEYEYAEKLGQENLTIEERDRLEDEFLEKKKTSLLPIYTLSLYYSERMNSIPESLVAKVLNHILGTWANHADRVKGVNRYQYSLVSRNILSEKDLQIQDYSVAQDMLRIAIERISDDIKKLRLIPGAQAVKVGDKATSLQDLQFRMEDVQQFKLGPLTGLIRQSGVSKDESITLGYLLNRLFELNLKEEAASANAAVYENSLSQYIQRTRGALTKMGENNAITSQLNQGATGNVPAMIPQFGASFLDNLIEMAQENSDMAFRQRISEKVIEASLTKVEIHIDKKYYQELYNTITAKPADDNITSDYPKSAIDRINRTHKEIYDALMQTVDEITAIYLDLSKYNLNPESLLYTLTKPVSTVSNKHLYLRKAINYIIIASAFAITAIFLVVLVIGSFINGSRRQKSKQSLDSSKIDI